MELHARLYQIDRLLKLSKKIAEGLGFHIRVSAIGYSPRTEMALEKRELLRKMGGSDKREFNRLLASWKGVP